MAWFIQQVILKRHSMLNLAMVGNTEYLHSVRNKTRSVIQLLSLWASNHHIYIYKKHWNVLLILILHSNSQTKQQQHEASCNITWSYSGKVPWKLYKINERKIKSITRSLTCDNCAQLYYNQLTEACYQY